MTAVYGRFTKQPGETLDYDVDFTEWFADRIDVPISSTVVADPGITIVSQVRTGTVIKVVVAGGTDGNRYKITATVTTAPNGLVKEADFIVAVKAV